MRLPVYLIRVAAVACAMFCLFGATLAARAAEESTGSFFQAPVYGPNTSQPRANTADSANGAYGNGAGSLRRGGGDVGESQAGPGGISGADSSLRMRDNDSDSRRVLRRQPLPPQKPNEFQKFVHDATGRWLPVFGEAFFRDADDPTREPADNAPVSGDYQVSVGDQIIVRAWGSVDIDYRAVVDRNGQVNLPKVGTFSVVGVKASELERYLKTQVGRVFTNFTLSASLGPLRGVKVFVVGPARRSGVYTLPSSSTVLSAVVAAGGPSSIGSMRKVELRRNGQLVSTLDIYDFLVQGDKSKDPQLASGDVVVITPVGPRVAITGAIDTPAVYELRDAQEAAGAVLQYAGGAPVLANPHLAQLERIDSSNAATTRAPRFVEEFKLDTDGMGKTLRDGDVLTLLPISPQFANAVTLKGHVAQPLRYAYKPGMRVSDLIPDREALISPDFYRRKNLLVQMIGTSDDERRARADRRERDEQRQRKSKSGANNPRAQTPDAFSNVDSNLRGSAQGDAANDADRDDGLYDRRERWRQESGRGDRDGLIDDRDVAYNGDDGKRPRTRLSSLFDQLNWDYAVIERLNLKELTTQVLPFNLGRAVIQKSPDDNLELQPGDVVTIFSQRDVRVPVSRQTRLVSLEGEVTAPGVYQLQPGETLRSLVARTGGFTAQAYLYGLEFSREEARQRQRENLQAALGRLRALAGAQAAREVANRREDGQSGAVSAAATQAQVTRLEQIEPNGRIALELSPSIRKLEELPDVPLENGDRILIPPRPGFVVVAGAVVNTNSLIWKEGRTTSDYVRLAGLDEAADPSNLFVLHADGTVATNRESRGFFGYGGLDSQPLQPGDAIIVPNQLDYETWGRALVRNLKDFAQIFSQFGLGAAAIQTLRNN